MKEECKKCKYFEKNENDYDSGWCKRYPPAISQYNNSIFPNIKKFDWCGEYKEKDTL